MDDDWLVWRYEASRPRLRGMAYRMLGSASDADDAVQEAWIHVAGGDASVVANLEGWFTTIVARVCLDMLRARKSRREEPVDAAELDRAADAADAADQEAVLADTVGIAMLVVLDTLGPAERVAFVLHEMFGIPFGEIASITGRSPASARQLASRARRRIRGGTDHGESAGSGDAGHGRGMAGNGAGSASEPGSGSESVPGSESVSGTAASGAGSASGAAAARSASGAAASGAAASGASELARQRALAEAFLAAARGGDLTALLAILDPDVVLYGDAVASGGKPLTIRGAQRVARASRSAASRTRYSGVVLIDGVPGIAYAPRGHLMLVLAFRYGAGSSGTGSAGTGTITGIDVIAEPAHLAALELTVPE
jgi:RNA polymerase sigma factor (sigma-70 family)